MPFEFDSQKPALVPDSLAPVDWMNVREDPGSWPRAYSLRQEIAGVAFASTLRVQREEISLQEALDRKYVSMLAESRLQGKALHLYRVVKLSGAAEEEALMQLWAEDFPVWIYESTRFRSSHYIFEEDMP